MLNLAQCYPPKQISPKSDDFAPQNFFEKSAKAKLSKLEPFARYHWIRNSEKYFWYQFRPRSHPGPEMAQLPQTFAKKNWKTSFLNEDQKVELVIRLFSDDFISVNRKSEFDRLQRFHLLRRFARLSRPRPLFRRQD